MASTTREDAPQVEPAPPPRQRRHHLLFAGRAARKVVVTTLGGLIALAGVVLLPLPGPGMLVVGLGLGLLSTEYRWPGRLSRWLRREAAVCAGRLRDRRRVRAQSRRRR